MTIHLKRAKKLLVAAVEDEDEETDEGPFEKHGHS